DPVLAIANPLCDAAACAPASAAVLARPLPVLAAAVAVPATAPTDCPSAAATPAPRPDAIPSALPAPVLLASAELCESAPAVPAPTEAVLDEPASLWAEPKPPTPAVPAAWLPDATPL
ncbi:MAG: hypothetical protein ACREFP_03685, partial [Acetobacteraceae bacterium]